MVTSMAIATVAVLHIVFLIMEMFLWTKPSGRRIFGITREFAAQTKIMAANQGLYNGFLAAGLLWGLIFQQPSNDTSVFFLVCVVVAGVYGGLTVKPVIFFVQALPAAIALLLVLESG
jgi:putative membrane protein